jgi:predicted ATPase/DNA-binding SARP family transcriptional activator/DNA-binding CsgD family transcriptional regulator
MDAQERLMRPQRAGRAEEDPREARVGRPETVRVWLLGGFRVSVGTHTVQEGAWRLRKAAALVKLLALAPGHHLHRERAMDILWPDHGRRGAANNLSQALHAARRALGPDDAQAASSYLASQGEQLVLCPAGELWLDVEAFEEAAATARRSREPAAYRAALNLYAGELLPRDPYEEWVEVPRESLRQLFLALLVELASLHEERGEYGSGIEALRRVVVEEPTREEAHIGLMRLYALWGRQAEALAQYARLEESLSRELGAEPQASSRVLREEIAMGRFPPPHRPLSPPKGEIFDPPRHNLPAPRTSFVGREREIVEVKRALSMTRLLTLTGAGGSGKTRLALEVARDLVGAYPDGVWLAELAGLSEGDLVPHAVAAALGVKERPGQPLIETLVDYLRDKVMLLVVDNCEHLVEAAARLADMLLDSCPRLRVLATSREALGIVGEMNWPVQSLSLPDPRQQPTVEELERYESVRLFMERARHRNPAFIVSPQNAQAVVEICIRLDGIPLAIELAAARVGLPVEQIAARLDDSLRLLTAGSRTATPRQQTLRGTMDWSYELLSEREQLLFARLSVFVGGWTFEAVELVGVGDGIEEEDVLDLLLRLVDKSLVVAEVNMDGAVRYRMLEPIRQYAWEKLKINEEAKEVQGRHAAFFLSLAEEAKTRWQGPEETAWLGRLEGEHDNLRAALSWALAGEDPELGLRLASALSVFWDERGHFSEGIRWLEEALDTSSASPRARAEALNGLGSISRTRSDFARAQMCHEEALGLYRAIGNAEGIADSLGRLGLVAQFQNDVARATTLIEESLAVAQQSGYLKIIPGILMSLAWIACDSGDIERAQQMWGEALKMARDREDRGGVLYTLFFMGYAELARGNQQRAMVLLQEALTLGRELDNRYIVAGCLMSLGIAATLRDDPERAKTLLGKSLAINLELGTKSDIAETLEGMAELAGSMGEDLRAARLWGAAEAIREAVGHSWSPTECLLHEPRLLAARSRLDEKTWVAAFAEGGAMTLEEAVDYALSEEEIDSPGTPTPEQASTTARPSALTRREQEVAKLVARSLTNRRIAKALVLSERTVDNHVRNILKKLNLSSRSEVAAWVEAQRS